MIGSILLGLFAIAGGIALGWNFVAVFLRTRQRPTWLDRLNRVAGTVVGLAIGGGIAALGIYIITFQFTEQPKYDALNRYGMPAAVMKIEHSLTLLDGRWSRSFWIVTLRAKEPRGLVDYIYTGDSLVVGTLPVGDTVRVYDRFHGLLGDRKHPMRLTRNGRPLRLDLAAYGDSKSDTIR